MILTKEIKTEKATILCVGGLPEDAFNIVIWARNDDCTIHELRYQAPSRQLVGLDIPQGEYKFFGKLHEITEEQWEGIIAYVPEIVGYLDYSESENIGLDTATESGLSLIESNCKLKNKYENPNTRHYSTRDLENDNSKYWKLYDKWQQEQETVFTNPVIFLRK